MDLLCKLPPKPYTLMVRPSKDIVLMILDKKTLAKYKYFSEMSNSMIMVANFENIHIRSLGRHFSACQLLFLDSAYQITPNQGVKPFSSKNACTCYFSDFFS